MASSAHPGAGLSALQEQEQEVFGGMGVVAADSALQEQWPFGINGSGVAGMMVGVLCVCVLCI